MSKAKIALFKLHNKPVWSFPFANKKLAVATWYNIPDHPYPEHEVINLDFTNTACGWVYEPPTE